jgi:hypothetical protein
VPPSRSTTRGSIGRRRRHGAWPRRRTGPRTISSRRCRTSCGPRSQPSWAGPGCCPRASWATRACAGRWRSSSATRECRRISSTTSSTSRGSSAESSSSASAPSSWPPSSPRQSRRSARPRRRS